MDALGIEKAVLAGYDWGGRAACIAAAVWPGRVRGLVTVDGYNIQNLAAAGEPVAPEWERTYWYQYYFHSERGRRGLARNRSYRHRFGLVDGDPRYQQLEDLIAQQPPIIVPTIVLESGDDGVGGPSAAADCAYLTGPYEHRLLPGVGHNVPQEAPEVFADAVASLLT